MIFNLFKSKPSLKELIPNGFVDIHSHILPGIDDGAKDLKNSINLIEEMKKIGFSKIIGTPHTYNGLYNNTCDTIEKSFNKLNKNIKEKIIIDYASEYMLDSSIIDKARKRQLLCLKENYVLVEMSYFSAPINIYEIIYEIKANDYIPILAHPERYLFFYDDFKNYTKLKRVGCLFQANLLSATSFYGRNVRKNLDKLLKYKLIDFVGSDIHNLNHIAAFKNKVKIGNIKEFKTAIEKNIHFS